MNTLQRLNDLNRRASSYNEWTLSPDGNYVLDRARMVAYCKDPKDAEFIVEMQRWFGRVVNLLILTRRKKRDGRETSRYGTADERRLRAVAEGADNGEPGVDGLGDGRDAGAG